MSPSSFDRRSGGLFLRGALALSLAGLFLLAAAGSAQALPKTPKLGGTYPASPGLSTTPRIYGWVDEVFVSRLGGVREGGPLTAAGGEEGTVTLYAQADCAGPEVAIGTASDLENSGIPVTVALGSTTTFSATNTDLTGVSACSNSIEYRQVSDPPAAPTVSAVSPSSPADDNHPRVIGSADDDSTIVVYADPGCAGTAVGSGPASAFEADGVVVAVADNSTTTFYARATWAGLPSPCSSTFVTYQEVSAAAPPGGGDGGSESGSGGGSAGGGGGAPSGQTAPAPPPAAPKLRTVPGGRANNALPLVLGSAPGGTKVQIYKNSVCAGRPAASGSAADLGDGIPVAVEENATTRFYAEAINGAGKASECSEPVAYVEDSSPPLTRITFGPGVKTRKRVAVFRFADITDELPGTSFYCKFDRRPWRACQTPFRVARLRFKVHTLRVRAIDAAGNEEARGASRRFKVIRAGL